MAATVFQATGFGMGLTVRPTTGHTIALMKFVQEYITSRLL
jgi:hypothetical protein